MTRLPDSLRYYINSLPSARCALVSLQKPWKRCTAQSGGGTALARPPLPAKESTRDTQTRGQPTSRAPPPLPLPSPRRRRRRCRRR